MKKNITGTNNSVHIWKKPTKQKFSSHLKIEKAKAMKASRATHKSIWHFTIFTRFLFLIYNFRNDLRAPGL